MAKKSTKKPTQKPTKKAAKHKAIKVAAREKRTSNKALLGAVEGMQAQMRDHTETLCEALGLVAASNRRMSRSLSDLLGEGGALSRIVDELQNALGTQAEPVADAAALE